MVFLTMFLVEYTIVQAYWVCRLIENFNKLDKYIR